MATNSTVKRAARYKKMGEKNPLQDDELLAEVLKYAYRCNESSEKLSISDQYDAHLRAIDDSAHTLPEVYHSTMD